MLTSRLSRRATFGDVRVVLLRRVVKVCVRENSCSLKMCTKRLEGPGGEKDNYKVWCDSRSSYPDSFVGTK
jgi:hypothetical protein